MMSPELYTALTSLANPKHLVGVSGIKLFPMRDLETGLSSFILQE